MSKLASNKWFENFEIHKKNIAHTAMFKMWISNLLNVLLKNTQEHFYVDIFLICGVNFGNKFQYAGMQTALLKLSLLFFTKVVKWSFYHIIVYM